MICMVLWIMLGIFLSPYLFLQAWYIYPLKKNKLLEHKWHKLKNINYLNNLFNSEKPLIIYKSKYGFDLYTDFSKKIGINYKTIKLFNPWLLENHLNNKSRKKYIIKIPN